jgi:hypothetical protein
MRELDEKNTNETSSRLRNSNDIPFSNVGFATLSKIEGWSGKFRVYLKRPCAEKPVPPE